VLEDDWSSLVVFMSKLFIVVLSVLAFLFFGCSERDAGKGNFAFSMNKEGKIVFGVHSSNVDYEYSAHPIMGELKGWRPTLENAGGNGTRRVEAALGGFNRNSITTTVITLSNFKLPWRCVLENDFDAGTVVKNATGKDLMLKNGVNVFRFKLVDSKTAELFEVRHFDTPDAFDKTLKAEADAE